VRRTNPRTPERLTVQGRPVRTPRIVRRGFPYGPVAKGASGPCGLMFMAYNASPADQFEVIQHWVNGGNSTGDLSQHSDPVVSHAHGRTITIHHQTKAHRLHATEPFVTLRWGTYLFTPSISALGALAERSDEDDEKAVARDEQALAAAGHEIIKGLEALSLLSGEEAGRTAWKLVLEDRFVDDDKRRALWAAIRSRGGGAPHAVRHAGR
jgi:hypothetical protein